MIESDMQSDIRCLKTTAQKSIARWSKKKDKREKRSMDFRRCALCTERHGGQGSSEVNITLAAIVLLMARLKSFARTFYNASARFRAFVIVQMGNKSHKARPVDMHILKACRGRWKLASLFFSLLSCLTELCSLKYFNSAWLWFFFCTLDWRIFSMNFRY